MIVLLLLAVCIATLVLNQVFLNLWPVTALALLLALCALALLLLRCRRNHPAWETLRRYRYAHRGLHDSERGIPENSLAAFRRAVKHGYGAELDVHLTRDGRLAIMHDNSLRRTANAEGRITDLTAEELGQYRLEGTGEKIPFLEEVLPLFEEKTPLIVELKSDDNNYAALAAATCAMLDRYRVDYCVESFDPRAVQWLRRHRPEICRGQLSGNFLRERGNMSLLRAFAMTNLLTGILNAPDFIAYNVLARDRLSVKLCRSVWGAQEVSWTIRAPSELAEAEADGRIPIFEGFIPE